MNKNDCPHAGECPRRFLEAKQLLHNTRDHATLAVEKEECHDANKGWKRGGEYRHGADPAAPAEFKTRQEERQRNPDRHGSDD